MVRSPLLPVENYLSLVGDPQQAASSALGPAHPEVWRALAIGSPSLLDALRRTLSDEKEVARLNSKLRRFLVRMSTRPTPYGTFAGVALAHWGSRTDLALDHSPRTRTRIDMDWLFRYVLQLETLPAVRNHLRWVKDSAAWVDHDRVTLLETSRSASGSQSGTVSVAATPVVGRVLELTRSPILYRALVERVIDGDESRPRHKVERLLEELWRLGFLLTDLMPPLTCDDPFTWVQERLSGIPAGKALGIQLSALRTTISECDTVPVQEVPKALHNASTHLSLLGQTQTRMPLQVDMALSLCGQDLSSKVASEAAHTAELLLRLAPAPAGPSYIAHYRDQFLARYGADREVPLLELLQPDWGLGFVQRTSAGAGAAPAAAAQRAETLQFLAMQAIREGQLSIDLDKNALGNLATQSLVADQLPTSIDLNVFVLASSASAIDRGDFQLMVGPNLGASTAGKNLGRFAHLLGDHALAALADAASHDDAFRPGGITAEVAYLPRNFRTANVAIRPAIRRYEAVRGISPGVSADHVIPLDQLVVGVRDDRFYVRWIALGCDVTFTSGTMLNPNLAPPEIQLLLELSHDRRARLSSFDWGPARGYEFLPRVQCERSILHCAQWRLRAGPAGGAPTENEKLFAEWFVRWRDRWRVPELAYLASADNRLLYNLDDPAQVDDLRHELRSDTHKGQCLLQEALPGPEHAWLPDADGGHHIVELVVSLGLHPRPEAKATAGIAIAKRAASLVPSHVRRRMPGSDWLYIKLYGPRSFQDELLATSVRSLGADVETRQLADEWFFVRYADPDPHLRLRFHGRPQVLLSQLLPQLATWASDLVEKGKCSRFGFESYEREVERYGGTLAMSMAESLFAIDSRTVVDLLACDSVADRLLLAVVTIDDLLQSLGLDEQARLQWLKRSVKYRTETGPEYRRRREHLTSTLIDPSTLGITVRQILGARAKSINRIAADLAILDTQGMLTCSLERLYESYVHMHFNRLLGDRTAERRALGLLLRTRETIPHLIESKVST